MVMNRSEGISEESVVTQLLYTIGNTSYGADDTPTRRRTAGTDRVSSEGTSTIF
jgi:hypothetical protein